MDRTQTFLKDLVEAHGAPGFESDVFAVMARYLKGVGTISRDRLGSFICEKKGGPGPKVMLAGHLDEVGFMVKSVTKEGFIKFLPLGGWWGHVVLAQQLVIKTGRATCSVWWAPSRRTSFGTRTARRCSRSGTCTSMSARRPTGT